MASTHRNSVFYRHGDLDPRLRGGDKHGGQALSQRTSEFGSWFVWHEGTAVRVEQLLGSDLPEFKDAEDGAHFWVKDDAIFVLNEEAHQLAPELPHAPNNYASESVIWMTPELEVAEKEET